MLDLGRTRPLVKQCEGVDAWGLWSSRTRNHMEKRAPRCFPTFVHWCRMCRCVVHNFLLTNEAMCHFRIPSLLPRIFVCLASEHPIAPVCFATASHASKMSLGGCPETKFMQSFANHRPCGNATGLKQVPYLPGIQKAFAGHSFTFIIFHPCLSVCPLSLTAPHSSAKTVSCFHCVRPWGSCCCEPCWLQIWYRACIQYTGSSEHDIKLSCKPQTFEHPRLFWLFEGTFQSFQNLCLMCRTTVTECQPLPTSHWSWEVVLCLSQNPG